MSTHRAVAQLLTSAGGLLVLAAVLHVHQQRDQLLEQGSPFTRSSQLAANRLAGFQTSFTPSSSGSFSPSMAGSNPSIGSTSASSTPSNYSPYPGAQRLEGYQPPSQWHASKEAPANRKQQKLRSLDAGTFAVPAGKQVAQVHVYIKAPPKKPQAQQAVRFSQNSINLFYNLAQQASQGLPTSDVPLPQSRSGYAPSMSQEADNTLASNLEQKLGAVQYEENRFHFAPERGPDFQGR